MPYDEQWLRDRMAANPQLHIASGHLTPVLPLDAPEKDLGERLRQLCKDTGHLAYHTWKSQHSAPGFPDWIIVHPDGGTLYALELKREGEHPSPAQRRWLEALGKVTRVEAATYWPKDWPHIVEILGRRTI